MKRRYKLIIATICCFITACNKSETAATQEPAASIIRGLESGSGYLQLDALDAVQQSTDSELLTSLHGKIEALGVSPTAESIVKTKVGTLLYQKYGEVDPRHAEAYTHLLFDDPSMADALKKAAKVDKNVTMQAIEAKEKHVLNVSKNLTRPEEQEQAKHYLSVLQSLKTEIEGT